MSELKNKLEKSIEALQKKFASIRTSRANPELLNRIQVSYYGTHVPLNQVASVSVIEGNTFMLNVFDANAISAVEKAILSSDLGLNPQTEGVSIRMRLPDMTNERRKELAKILQKESEQAKVALRNIRRDHLNHYKRLDDTSDDDYKNEQQTVQKVLDDYIKRIDELYKLKETELMTG